MTPKQALVAISIIAAGFTATMANAAGNNPLHPSYFAEKANAPVAVKQSGVRYVDAGNPLSPAFKRSGGEGIWTMTATTNVQPYVDRNNPLSPSYKRS